MSSVLTGIGTVGPWGVGTEALAEALRSGRATTSEIEITGEYHAGSSARTAGLVDMTALRKWLPGAAARRMSRNSRMTLAAARLAAEDAGLAEEAVGGERTAISMGTSFASSEFTARLLQQMREGGPQSTSPFLFMETVANAYSGQVAMHFGARGSNATITQGEASGALAVARANYLLATGSADRVLCGSVEEMSEVSHAMLDRFRSLSRPSGGTPEQARVFDRRRTGCLASEGATVLLLETEEVARARGARVLGRVRCAIRAFDPTATSHGWGTGAVELAAALTRGFARAGLDPTKIDRIVSGASGSLAGDRLEGRVLREVWRDEVLPPVLAPKGVTGEYGGGLLAAAVVALSDAPVGPTAGFEEVDPEIGIRPHDGSALPAPERILVSSLASGGAACWLVLERDR